MHRPLVIVILASALAVTGCGQVLPSPPSATTGSASPAATRGESPSPAVTPSSTPVAREGTVALDVRGTIKGSCPSWPGGCGYWVTLVEAGGITHRAPLERIPAQPARLTLGEGLPAAIPPGSYALVFEVEEFSDVASFAPDGTELQSSYTAVACAGAFGTGAAIKTTVRVTFEGDGCRIRTVETYE